MERIVTVNGREYKWPLKPLAVICIDGSEPEYIEKAVQAGLMPFTAQLLNTGIDLRVDCVIPSFTNPNNVSIVTGCPPSMHGICGNFFYDLQSESEVMMNDPKYMHVPTIFSAFEKEGAKILVVTAKDKLRKLLGHGLTFGSGGSICVSAEKADIANLEENGCEDLLNLTGLPLPNVYSADLSEFVFASGLALFQNAKPDLIYLSTTDYIQHKFAPGTEGANRFYHMMDGYWSQLSASGADLVLTADHGMSGKHDNKGNPDVIYLQDSLDTWLGAGVARVILPITDPYVAHHGALGSFATIYIPDELEIMSTISKLKDLNGIVEVLGKKEACERFDLPGDRIGDIVIISEESKVLGINPDHHDFSGLDVPLRSHGGLSEQVVPLISSKTFKTEATKDIKLRNFDAFHLGLNLT